MLQRVWATLLGLALPWVPQTCTYGGDDDGGHGGSSTGHGGASGASGGGASSLAGVGGLTGLGGGGLATGGTGGKAAAAGASSAGAGTSGAGSGSGGTAGTVGAAGASVAGTAGVQQSRFTLSDTLPGILALCEVQPGPLTTITNTSSLPLTWHATTTFVPGILTVVVTPPGSTLAPGEAVTLLVSCLRHWCQAACHRAASPSTSGPMTLLRKG